MSLVLGVVPLVHQFPLVGIDSGKEGIRFKTPVDPSEFQVRGQVHGLTVDFPPSAEIGRFILPDPGNGTPKGMDQGTGKFRDVIPVPADGYMLPLGQGLGEAFQGLAPHDDLMAGGQRLEAFEIVREPPNQIIVLSQGIVLPGRGDQYQSPHPSFFLFTEERGNSVSISFWIWEILSRCRATKRSRCLRSQSNPMNLWVTKKLKAWMAKRKLQPRMAQTNQS